MNRCPTCDRLYEADVQFCPTDGTPLEAVVAPPVARVVAPAMPAAQASQTLPILVGVLVVAVVALVGFLLWQQQQTSADLSARTEAAETEAATARLDAEQQRNAARAEASRAAAAAGEAQQASAERDEASAAARSAAASARAARAAAQTPRPEPVSYTRTGIAYSPSDGFLALRSAPTSSSTMVYRIPHQAPVALGACRSPIPFGDRTGSWCRARYDGRTGWIFDAFISYGD